MLLVSFFSEITKDLETFSSLLPARQVIFEDGKASALLLFTYRPIPQSSIPGRRHPIPKTGFQQISASICREKQYWYYLSAPTVHQYPGKCYFLPSDTAAVSQQKAWGARYSKYISMEKGNCRYQRYGGDGGIREDVGLCFAEEGSGP